MFLEHFFYYNQFHTFGSEESDLFIFFFASDHHQAVGQMGSLALSVGSTTAMEIEDDANSKFMVIY